MTPPTETERPFHLYHNTSHLTYPAVSRRVRRARFFLSLKRRAVKAPTMVGAALAGSTVAKRGTHTVWLKPRGKRRILKRHIKKHRVPAEVLGVR